VALRLKRLGIERVRPLAGGIEAWRERALPVVPWVRALAGTETRTGTA
jgi:rhodanese-related sulfurtransferase